MSFWRSPSLIRLNSRLGLSVDQLEIADWGAATPGVFGLTTLEEIAGLFYNRDPMVMQCSVLCSICSDQDRIRSLAVFEWARLNPNKIVDLILRMDKEEEFRSVLLS